MLKITADENIALAEEAFSTLGKVTLMPGREITNGGLRDADVLITRSITKVDEDLLDGTRVRFVGTATIGTDHIDLQYLKKKEIHFADAKGCNANAVAEYVFAGLYNTAAENHIRLRDLTIGIIGAGNIGSRVAAIAVAARMNVLLNDPPLKRTTGGKQYLELKEILDADIISLHVPLTLQGTDRTFHLFDRQKLNRLKDNCILINTSRGEVIDNADWAALNKPGLISIIDVWENEPIINRDLLKKAAIATPHIAGYSLEGKINGTVMIYNELCRYLGAVPEWYPELPPTRERVIKVPKEGANEEKINDVIKSIYDIKKDDEAMRKILTLDEAAGGKYFDQLRKEYPLRREIDLTRMDE